MALSKKRTLRSAAKIESEYFSTAVPILTNKNTSKIRKQNNGNRQIIKPEYEEEKSEIVIQIKEANQSEESWTPPNWDLVYDAIQKMRLKRDAVVDQMGAEKCCDKNMSPKVQRFHTLIGLMLSSQTRDQVTHAAVVKLQEHGLTIENIINTPVDVLQKLIYPVGFYKKKADYILSTCQILKEKYDSDIPPTVKELCSLPGVGNKMAYICMDVAWNKLEGIGVDTHVHRISNRLGWTGKKPTKSPEDTRKALEDWLPKERWRDMNLMLVGFGQQICLPIRPKCEECLAREFCPYGSSLPKKKSLSKTKK